jgi:hypothetical protein
MAAMQVSHALQISASAFFLVLDANKSFYPFLHSLCDWFTNLQYSLVLKPILVFL